MKGPSVRPPELPWGPQVCSDTKVPGHVTVERSCPSERCGETVCGDHMASGSLGFLRLFCCRVCLTAVNKGPGFKGPRGAVGPI
ncbi:unnamed protein product [Rangifer tarandus platyrhynchus]|uniref:Uncharacterized protein n=1 Tax=Rangifer tarandus platyrhynchus TaxID=3082113 RepID=A0AC59Z6E9_RANTA